MTQTTNLGVRSSNLFGRAIFDTTRNMTMNTRLELTLVRVCHFGSADVAYWPWAEWQVLNLAQRIADMPRSVPWS